KVGIGKKSGRRREPFVGWFRIRNSSAHGGVLSVRRIAGGRSLTSEYVPWVTFAYLCPGLSRFVLVCPGSEPRDAAGPVVARLGVAGSQVHLLVGFRETQSPAAPAWIEL